MFSSVIIFHLNTDEFSGYPLQVEQLAKRIKSRLTRQLPLFSDREKASLNLHFQRLREQSVTFGTPFSELASLTKL